MTALGSASSLAARLASDPMTEALGAGESETLAYIWELHKFQGDRLSGAASCWDLPELLPMAYDEELQMGILGEHLIEYGVPFPSDPEDNWSYSGGFLTEEFELFYYVCWARPPMVNEHSAYVEEIAIRDLRAAMNGTSEQSLIDAYSGALLSAYGHLRQLAAMLGDPADYVAQVLTQADVDAILDEVPPPAEAFAINATLNDTWFYPGTDGQGFFVTVYPDRLQLMVGWFTYDTEQPSETATAHLGHSCQRWLTAQGPYSGDRAELTVYSSSGGLFDTFSPAVNHEPVGSLEMHFEGCNAGTVTYSLPGIDAFGVIPIERIALDNLAACEARYPQTK
jgi:hypothetical protein